MNDDGYQCEMDEAAALGFWRGVSTERAAVNYCTVCGQRLPPGGEWPR